MVIAYQSVESSNIDQVGYDPETRELRVKFLNGTEYSYAAVPGAVFVGFVGAESAGKFLHSEIKGKYEYAKVGQKEEENDL